MAEIRADEVDLFMLHWHTVLAHRFGVELAAYASLIVGP